jgi:hypothetical protein
MSEKNVTDPEKVGLRLENWESQDSDGNVEKAIQREKEVATTQFYANAYTQAVRKNKEERDDAKEAFESYSGKQWDQASLAILANQNRPANTYNYIKPNVDILYGQMILNPNTITFTTMNQDKNGPKNIVQSLYEMDFERGSWQKEKNNFTKNVIIHTGIIEMFKDYRTNTLGNIGLRSLNRYLDIEFDPFWKTDDMNECNMAFKSSWVTARDLKDSYRTRSEEIDQSIKSMETIAGVDQFTDDVVALAERDELFYDATQDRYRVVEVIYMQKIYKTKTYSKKYDRYLEENENPDTFRGANDTLIDYEECINVCKVMTMAPGVAHGLILQEGDHPIQVGRLPFFVASVDNTMGYRQGSVKGVIDAQNVLNKRQSMILGNQITSSNGSMIVKPSVFANKAEHQKFMSKKNSPGMVFDGAEDADISAGITLVPTGKEPTGLQEQVNWTQRFMETYFNNTDSVVGRSGGANESGVLFESKRNQSAVAHVNLAETLSQIDKEIAEAYFLACKKVYAGPHRTFTNSKTGEQVEVNKRVNASYNEFLSGFTTINEIATLPRHDVIIKKSELGLDQKQRSLSIYNEMAQRSTNPILKSQYEMAMIPLLDLPPDMIEEMQLASKIFIELQLAQTKSQITAMNNNATQSNIQTEQLEAQAEQANAPQQPQGAPIPDARTVANGAGQGNLPQGIAEDSSGANNQANSDR